MRNRRWSFNKFHLVNFFFFSLFASFPFTFLWEDVTVSSWRTISIYDGSSQECLFFAKFNTKKRSFRWLHIASQADTALFVTAKEKMRFVVRKYLQGKSVVFLSIDKILPKNKYQTPVMIWRSQSIILTLTT